jgi:hypothetical protein
VGLQKIILSLKLSFPLSVTQQPNTDLERLSVEVSISHTIRHAHTHTHTHTRWDSSLPVISSSQRPLPAQRRTYTRDGHICPQRDSNPQVQQSSYCRSSHMYRDRRSNLLVNLNMILHSKNIQKKKANYIVKSFWS